MEVIIDYPIMEARIPRIVFNSFPRLHPMDSASKLRLDHILFLLLYIARPEFRPMSYFIDSLPFLHVAVRVIFLR